MVVKIAPALTSAHIAAQNQEALRQIWRTIEPNSCPHDYNFHMHTTCSDGQLEPKQVIEQAIAIGLKEFAITDHHTVSGYKIARSWLDYIEQVSPSSSMPHLWIGVEITCKLLGVDVHILGYGFDPTHPAIAPYLQGKAPVDEAALAEVVIHALHQSGGLTVLAHPLRARYQQLTDQLIAAAADLGIDGVETYYAYANPDPWEPSPEQTAYVKQLGMRYNLLHTCGTDTHGLSLLKRL